MIYVVCFDPCRNPDINLPIMSLAGDRDSLSHMQTDEYLEANGIRFTIFDENGAGFVTGLFSGQQRDRDVPLEIARIHARDLASPIRIVYVDGVAFRHDKRFDMAVPE